MRKLYFIISLVLYSILVKAQSLYFPPNFGNSWDTISPTSLGYCQPQIDSLYAFLDSNNTKAFILLKDGKIVLEKYFGTHTQSSLWQWASAGKTITSFMTGIAQQEGFLSITDTSSNYLGQGWTSCTPLKEEKITIRNQLTMTSGLDDAVADPYCTTDTCLIYKSDAGTRWAYHNGPYTLLDQVIQNATGVTLNSYTTQKLKSPTGMTGSFFQIGYNNVFFSSARSMARFGLLILNKGNWNGNQIMTDSTYFNQMVNTSQTLNLSYGYLWWLNGKSSFMIPSSQFVFPGTFCPNAPGDMISAIGSGGQFLNVVPSQNLIWLRMGDDPANSMVPFLLNNDIWAYVNDLQCSPSGIVNVSQINKELCLFPNPVTDALYFKSNGLFTAVEIYNQLGQAVHVETLQKDQSSISVQKISPGIYYLRLYSNDGLSVFGKFVKNK